MAEITRLPGPDDDVDAFMAVAQVVGEENLFEFIRLCRTYQRSGDDVAGDAMTELAKSMVAKEQDKANVDFDTARRKVAARLGYTDGGTRSNFYKILAGLIRPDKRVKVAGVRTGKKS